NHGDTQTERRQHRVPEPGVTKLPLSQYRAPLPIGAASEPSPAAYRCPNEMTSIPDATPCDLARELDQRRIARLLDSLPRADAPPDRVFDPSSDADPRDPRVVPRTLAQPARGPAARLEHPRARHRGPCRVADLRPCVDRTRRPGDLHDGRTRHPADRLFHYHRTLGQRSSAGRRRPDARDPDAGGGRQSCDPDRSRRGAGDVDGRQRRDGPARRIGRAAGGHGTAIAWAPTLAEKFGLANAMEIGVTAATFGLVAGGILGGPLGRYLIRRHGLKPTGDAHPSVGVTYAEEPRLKLDVDGMLNTLLVIAIAVGIGTHLNALCAGLGLRLPQFVTALFAGIILRNTVPHLFPKLPWPT